MENTTVENKSSLGWIGSSVCLIISLFLLQDANHADSGPRTLVSVFLVIFFTLALLFSLAKRAD